MLRGMLGAWVGSSPLSLTFESNSTQAVHLSRAALCGDKNSRSQHAIPVLRPKRPRTRTCTPLPCTVVSCSILPESSPVVEEFCEDTLAVGPGSPGHVSESHEEQPPPLTADEQIRLQGREAEGAGDTARARDLYRECVDTNPHNGKAWQELAKLESKLHRGSVFRAIDIVTEAVAHNRDNAFLWQTLGLLHSRTRNLKAARECFQSGIDADDSHAALYTTWGRVESMNRNMAEARRIFEAGVRKGVKTARLYHTWGLAEEKHGSKNKALALYKRGLQIEPDNEYILQNLGTMAMNKGDHEQARSYFQKALTKMPDDTVVLETWGRLETRNGNIELARSLFKRAGSTCGNEDPRVLQSWSVLESKEGNCDEARDLADRALKLKKSDPILWYRLGCCEADLKNFARARALFKESASRNPRDWLVFDSWSAMEWECGNFAASKRLLERSYAVRYHAKGAFEVLTSPVRDQRLRDRR